MDFYDVHGKRLVNAIGSTTKKHALKFSIISRCLLLLTSICRDSELCCDEAVDLKLHELSATLFNQFETDVHLRQLIIYFLDACVMWPKSKSKIHTSVPCMEIVTLAFNMTHKISHMITTSPEQNYPVILPFHMTKFFEETEGKAVAIHVRKSVSSYVTNSLYSKYI